MSQSKYKDYFKNHYCAKFAKSDIDRDKKWFYTQFKFIKSLINLKLDSKVLEIGSGFGGLYDYLNCNNYTGIDMDKEVVGFTNKYFKVDKFVNTSLEDFETKEEYDYIFAIEVLEHFSDPISNIAKIKKLLNNKGVFVGTTPYPFKKNIDADKTHNFVLHPENWKRLFLNEGFSVFKYYPMTFLPLVWRLNKYLNFRIPFYLPFRHFISTTLIIARK